MTTASISDPAAIAKFVMAGNATFTLVSKKTEARFTFKVRASEDNAQFFFVSVLTGPDNWSNYQYLGYIRREVYFHGGEKAKIGRDAPSARAFNWFYQLIVTQGAPLGQLEFWHEGKCGRCGKKLTVPASIESGFGPECVTKIGGFFAELVEAPKAKRSAYGKAGDPFSALSDGTAEDAAFDPAFERVA